MHLAGWLVQLIHALRDTALSVTRCVVSGGGGGMGDVIFGAVAPGELVMFRKRRGITQAGLAELLGVSKRGVEDWEGGRRTPPAFLRLALAALISGAEPWRVEPVVVWTDPDGFRVRYEVEEGVTGPMVVRQVFASNEQAERFCKFWAGQGRGVQ